MKYCKLFIFLIPAMLFFQGCITQPKTDVPPVKEELTEEMYYRQGMEYLKLPGTVKFFNYINEYHLQFQEQTKALLDVYGKEQEKLINFFLEKRDFYKAGFFANNLSILEKGSDKKSVYKEKIREGFKNSKSFATYKYINLQNYDSINSYSPLTPVIEYNKLLVEIYVDRTYELKDNSIRKDFPGAFGSGILMDPEHILTAYHVIEHVFTEDTLEYNITVKSGDRKMEHCTILAWDSLSDLVILELPGKIDMPYDFYKLLGNSDNLEQGFEIYCLGHHSGLTSTLTKGIIGAVKRKAPEVDYWIQIDANITPGASGGMLIGNDGLIYGLLVAGLPFEDINFAIPSNLILSILDTLKKGISVRRGWAGLLLENSEEEKGVVTIRDIFTGAPVLGTGIAIDDRLTEINGIKIDSVERAQHLIYSLEAGNIVKIQTVGKENTTCDAWIPLKRRPDYAIYNATKGKNQLATLYPHFGFTIDTGKIETRTVTIANKRLSLNIYKVIMVQKNTYLDSMGVKPGDYLGFIDDYYRDKTRYIELLYIPVVDKKLDKEAMKIENYIFYMKKGKYDENIL